MEERCKRLIKIGVEWDHVLFLVQGFPIMSVRRIVTTINCMTAREIFLEHTYLNM